MKKSKRHELGQHFLQSPGILSKITQCVSPQKEDIIIEIGAGKGNLTGLLAEKAKKVIAIEKDAALIPILKNKQYPNVEIWHGDVLKVDFEALFQNHPVKAVGNLPYSISTPLLSKILTERRLFSACFFLLQKEVGERICAREGSKKYAPVSIFAQNHFFTRVEFSVSPGSFAPSPKVHSVFISMKKRQKPCFPINDEESFTHFIYSLFRGRRKKLKNNLKNQGLSPQWIERALQTSQIEKNLRPEQVTLEQYVKLYHCVKQEVKKPVLKLY